MTLTTVQIPGIHCESCGTIIRDMSAEFPAIKHIDVDVATKKVSIDHGDDFDFAKWKQEIEALGDTYQIRSLS